jgi:phospholipid transport system substrate-binding protein
LNVGARGDVHPHEPRDIAASWRIELARQAAKRQVTTVMRAPTIFALLASLALLVFSGTARAEDAKDFIQREHAQLERVLHQPDSAGRDSEVNTGLDSFVDYDELTRRAFGEPCHATLPGCEDLWSTYDDGKKQEVGDLLKQLVRKSYRKNLLKTLDFDITYKGLKDQGNGDIRVYTEAQDKAKPHEPPVRVDYIVRQTAHGMRVVDIVTEGSSLSKNYYEQFRKKMHDPALGYPNIVAKLREKIAKKD